MNRTVIIVAGGKGERMKTNIPKQFLLLQNLPILMHTIKKFFSFDSKINIILVLPSNQIDYWKTLCKEFNFNIKHKIIEGGKERFFSVKNALASSPNDGLTAIHDGVRPLIDIKVIKKGFEIAQKYKTAIPVIKQTSSVRIIKNNESEHFDRDKIRIVQTPQIFVTKILKKAYSVEYSNMFTDDASVVEANENKIVLFEGNIENVKITTKFDIDFAETLLSAKTKN